MIILPCLVCCLHLEKMVSPWPHPTPTCEKQASVTWSLGLQSRPTRCDKATAESNPVTQKLISSTESELQQSYAKQRRTKSAALLHKELNCKSKRAVRDYLFRVNEATAILYARHVLASLLAEWPGHVPVSEDILELSGPAHMTYIFDMFMQLEEKHRWEKVIKQAKLGTHPSHSSSVLSPPQTPSVWTAFLEWAHMCGCRTPQQVWMQHRQGRVTVHLSQLLA